jgi:hypothetical protein
VASDAFAVIDYKAVFHSPEVLSQTLNHNWLGSKEKYCC